MDKNKEKSSNVVSLRDYKSNIEKLNDIQEEVRAYQELKEETINILCDPTKILVARDNTQARAIAKMILEFDPTIAYCRMHETVSRLSSFIEIIPVRTTEEQKVIFPHNDLGPSYIEYLKDTDQCEIVGNMIIPKD